MKQILKWESAQSMGRHGGSGSSKHLKSLQGVRMVSNKMGRKTHHRDAQCSECGTEVNVIVSPKRNPHSSKLGRAVSLKDHDLCRRCWRNLMHQQRQAGILTLPPSLFIGGKTLHLRLLIATPTFMLREAS